ncbi:voltage-dependent anion channel, partial [Kipferlia bialata]
ISICLIIICLGMCDLWEEEHSESGEYNGWYYTCLVFCYVGVVSHTALSFMIIMEWLSPNVLGAQFVNPTNLIPPVANIIMGLSLAKTEQTELGWFFWASGVIMYLGIFAMSLTLMVTGKSMPPKLRTTIFIWAAPGALAFIAYSALTGGTWDVMARLFCYSGLYFWFFAMVFFFVRIAPWMLKKFEVTWWAITFPSASTAVSTFDLAKKMEKEYGAGNNTIFKWISWFVAATDFVFVALCLVASVVQGFRGNLFVAEGEGPKPKQMLKAVSEVPPSEEGAAEAKV